MDSGQQLDDEPLVTFDWTNFDGPSEAVIGALFEVSRIDPLDAEPLYDVVDPDALDSLFSPTRYSRRGITGSVHFDYLGYHVVIEADGQGYIYDGEGRRPGTGERANAPECP